MKKIKSIIILVLFGLGTIACAPEAGLNNGSSSDSSLSGELNKFFDDEGGHQITDTGNPSKDCGGEDQPPCEIDEETAADDEEAAAMDSNSDFNLDGDVSEDSCLADIAGDDNIIDSADQEQMLGYFFGGIELCYNDFCSQEDIDSGFCSCPVDLTDDNTIDMADVDIFNELIGTTCEG
jgi:hypothetical protein